MSRTERRGGAGSGARRGALVPGRSGSSPDREPASRRRARTVEESRCRARTVAAAGLLALLACATACRQDMYDQPKATPLGESDFFADRRSARGPVPGTVARGQLAENRAYETGIGPDGTFVDAIPVAVDRALLLRGRERFDVFCSPCHARTGTGEGMIVQRGYKRPPSLHEPRLRGQAIGYFFDVVTNGFGEMPSYRSQVPVADRWAIAAYIRALQLSQNAPLAALTAEDRRAVDAAPTATSPFPGEQTIPRTGAGSEPDGSAGPGDAHAAAGDGE